MDENDKDSDGFPGVDQLIGSFMGEAALWPVLVVVIGSAGTLGAALLILAGIDRNPFAAMALILIFGMCVDVAVQARRKHRFRNLAKLIGLIWCVTLALAALAIWTGIAF